MPEHTRASDFRFIPADSISLEITDNAAKLFFAIEDRPNKQVIDSVAIYLTHRSLKVLSILLQNGVAHHEKATGAEIEIDEEKMQEAIDAASSGPTDAEPQT